MTTESRILDCGHAPSEHSAFTTGTAHTPDGREICIGCADIWQRTELLTVPSFMAYLSSDGKEITTWTGGRLGHVKRATVAHVNAFGHGQDRTYLRVVDVHGQRWHGTSPGCGMFARMRRSK